MGLVDNMKVFALTVRAEHVKKELLFLRFTNPAHVDAFVLLSLLRACLRPLLPDLRYFHESHTY